MSTVLDGLRERLELAKGRLARAQMAHVAATNELNLAVTEHNTWNAAVQIEQREEAGRQLPLAEFPRESQQTADSATQDLHEEPINRTELVREQLRLHAGGMTTPELWKALSGQITSRAYLYSILKRLRDRDEITRKRGKNILKPKPTEEAKGGGLERIPIRVQ